MDQVILIQQRLVAAQSSQKTSNQWVHDVDFMLDVQFLCKVLAM